LCPTCGEEVEGKLPVYVAEQLPHIRVEACDTCKFYLRTVDLTKDGTPSPWSISGGNSAHPMGA